MAIQRQYWVVSPNVRFNSRTVGAWREASVKWKAAFMGWQPNDPNHKIGGKFARDIQPGDVILIARRHQNEPEVVGFGRVVGEFKTSLAGFRPVETFGSLRRLHPFVPFSRAPKNLPFMDAITQIAALRKLDPENNPNHERLCRWLDGRLLVTNLPHHRDSSLRRDLRRRIVLTLSLAVSVFGDRIESAVSSRLLPPLGWSGLEPETDLERHAAPNRRQLGQP